MGLGGLGGLALRRCQSQVLLALVDAHHRRVVAVLLEPFAHPIVLGRPGTLHLDLRGLPLVEHSVMLIRPSAVNGTPVRVA